MPVISEKNAAERIASVVEKYDQRDLAVIYDELNPTTPVPPNLSAKKLADQIRHDSLPEDLVDLWKVVFPRLRKFRYDVDDRVFTYREDGDRDDEN